MESDPIYSARLRIVVGDITQQDAEAIVNAANASLMGGGGVDGAIHRAGGPAILAACRALRASRYPEGLPTGHAVITPGGRLRARYVIHTVGPVFGQHGGREPELLAACYASSLELAAAEGVATIAFPAISTGVYGYPKEEAACVAWRAIRLSLERHASIAEVRLVYFSESDAAIARRVAAPGPP